jgi:hypothetical protein
LFGFLDSLRLDPEFEEGYLPELVAYQSGGMVVWFLEVAGNEQLAGFFRDVQRTYASVAGRTEEMLDNGGEGRTPTGVSPGGVPAEGDPGDVSPGQDVTTPAAEVPPRPAP